MSLNWHSISKVPPLEIWDRTTGITSRTNGLALINPQDAYDFSRGGMSQDKKIEDEYVYCKKEKSQKETKTPPEYLD